MNEWSFDREGLPYLACNERNASTKVDINGGRFQNMCEALTYLLDNVFIRFATKLYRQIVEIPMGTNCASLIADFFLVCDERDFLSYNKEAEIIQARVGKKSFRN